MYLNTRIIPPGERAGKQPPRISIRNTREKPADLAADGLSWERVRLRYLRGLMRAMSSWT